MHIAKRLSLAIAFAAAILSSANLCAADSDAMVVYKNASCGCSGKWIEHMQRNGFRVVAHNVDNVATYKTKHRVPDALGWCHTAVVGGYAVEGHVPADTVKRLLKEKPANVAGISAPGMPQGSPGMESPTPQRYEVLAFDAKGRSWVYARH